MSKHLNICNIYIFLWCLYSLQGVLYAKGSIISQAILLVLLLISLYYTVQTIFKTEMPPYLKAAGWLLAMFTVYGMILILSKEQLYVRGDDIGLVSNKDYLKNIYSSFLPIYTFFVFAKQGLLTESLLRKWMPIFLVIVIAAFFRTQNEQLAEAEELLSNKEEFTNNTGYIFLSMIPLLLFVKKPILQYLLLLVCVVFIIAAMKRGAIIICAISLIPFFLWTLKGLSFGKKLLISTLIVASAFAIIYYISYMLDTSEYFQNRLDQTLEGDASGRDENYLQLLKQIFYFATPLQFLFGIGAWGTLKVADNFAHNDWLELGVNQGVLGVVSYVIYWIAFYITARGIKYNNTARYALMLIILIYFTKTMFSMSYDSMPIYATIVIGYCLANYSNPESKVWAK